MSDIITVNDLNLWYGPAQALHHVTISVPGWCGGPLTFNV